MEKANDEYSNATMANTSNGNIYTVQEGDTLSGILEKKYGNGSYEYYTEFAKNNGIENPDLIYPGQKINLDTQGFTQNTTSNNNSSTSASTTNNDSGDIILDLAEEKELLTKTNLDSSVPNNTSSPSQSTSSEENVSAKSNTPSVDASKNTPTATNSTSATVPSAASPSTNYMNTSVTYANSTYIICNPKNVKGWKPLNSFKTFIVKERAGEEFVAVDQCVKKCSNDIDGIVNALNKLKTTMGDNTGTTTQIDKIVTGLQEKKQDLITKEKELIEACEQVVQYIYDNKANKTREAAQVAATIAGIQL